MRCTSSRFFTAPPRRLAADAERQAAVRVHFDRHLVVAAADAARLDFERRLDVLDRLLEHLDRVVAGLLLDGGQAAVHDLLGGAALAVAHQRADELGDQRAAVDRIERYFALRDFSTSRHKSVSSFQLPAISFRLPARCRHNRLAAGRWRPVAAATTSASWRRTSNGPVFCPGRRRRRACRGRRGSARRGDP